MTDHALDPCPHCGTDLTDRWLQYEYSTLGHDVEQRMDCPECGLNVLA